VTLIGTARHRLPIWLVAGLALGLFLARVIAEAIRAPWSLLALVALVVAACAALAWLARWLDGRGAPVPVVPALVLLVYVLWPQRDWAVALTVIAIAFLSWLVGFLSTTAFADHFSLFTFHASHFMLIDTLTFVTAFIIYLATLQKDILPADSGEFQVVTTTLRGILHQPGYPLYTLVGKLFTLLPLGTPAFRLNLMSVFLAAGTLTLAGATVRKMLSESWGAVWGGLAAVLALGTSTTFWAQATTANIRMPTAFFTAWCLYLLIAYRQSPIPRVRSGQVSNPSATLRTSLQSPMSRDRYLTLFALAFSLGFGHYFVLGVMGLFFVVYLVLADPALIRQPRRWWRPIAVFVLAQLVWLYLPIHAAIAPTPETRGLLSPGGFLWYALGQGFAGDMFAFAGPEQLPARLALLPTLFPFQMNLGLLAAALVSAALLMWRDWRAGMMLIGGFLAHTFIAITYRAPQTVEYEIPAYVVLAVILGFGVGQISNLKSQISNSATLNDDLKFEIWNLKFVLVAAVIVAGLANGTAHAPSYITLANDRSTREYVEPILRNASANAIILSDWHYATPMWYLQQVEGLRNDVEVRYVYPIPGQEWSQVWLDLIAGNIVSRTVIVTHYWGSQYPTLPYIFEPFGQAWQVRSEPSFDVPPDLTPLSVEFDGKLRLAGYHLSLTRASPGQPLEVTLALQSIGQLDRDYALTVRLVDANGARRTQQDRGYSTKTFAPGEVRVDRFTLPLESTLPPGPYSVVVGVYYAPPEGCCRNLKTSDGTELATVATLDLVLADKPLPTLHPLDVSFAGGPTLTGVDYDWSNSASLQVYLHWRGPSAAGIATRIGDAAVTLPELNSGVMFVTAYSVPPTVPLQLNLTSGEGNQLIASSAWGWPVSSVPLSNPRSSDRYVLLSDQMALIGVESPRRTVAPGQPIDVMLRFLSLKPLVTGNKVSVRIEGEDLRISSDDHPAANAIPTLKWIAGSVVEDRRRFKLPDDARPGRVSGYMRVYDEFREDVLPPDDVFLGEWNLVR